MTRSPTQIITAVLVTVLLTTGCSGLKKRMLGSTFDGLSKAIFEQPDVRLVEDALPAYLLLMDGFLVSSPEDPGLLRTAAQSYSAYAGAFVEEEEAGRLTHLYGRAWQYSMRLLELEHPAVADAMKGPSREFGVCLDAIEREDVPDLFMAGTCLAGWITSNPDDPGALAEQPKLVSLMERLLELDETHSYGGPHLFFGIYHGVKPKAVGGEPETSKMHFEKALALSGDRFLMTRVLYAQYHARQVFDRELYDSLLEEVLAADVEQYPETRLMNEVARIKSASLLELADEYF